MRSSLLLSAAAATFAAAAPPAAAAPSFSFVTFGDWGTGSALQTSNAAAINAHCAAEGACNFILSLGDQFYNGPLSIEDLALRVAEARAALAAGSRVRLAGLHATPLQLPPTRAGWLL